MDERKKRASSLFCDKKKEKEEERKGDARALSEWFLNWITFFFAWSKIRSPSRSSSSLCVSFPSTPSCVVVSSDSGKRGGGGKITTRPIGGFLRWSKKSLVSRERAITLDCLAWICLLFRCKCKKKKKIDAMFSALWTSRGSIDGFFNRFSDR